MNECDMLIEARKRFIAKLESLSKESNGRSELNDEVVVSSPLSSREAIGVLDRDDFPLLIGKEVLMQAVYRAAAGQAFTSTSGSFRASLGDVLDQPLTGTFERVLVSTMNAVLRHFGLVNGTVHCRDDGAKKMCGPRGEVDKRAGYRSSWACRYAASPS